jgi:ATP-dependent exoDNAse (exonuclease V) beta subunit
MKLDQLNTEYGRYYRIPSGEIYPSVTTVLDTVPHPELDAWRDAVGHDKADKIAAEAARRGTRFHAYCEAWLKGERPKLDVFDTQAFFGIERHLKLIKPYLIETRMYSSKLRSAGTLDCFGKYDGTLAIIDFKTTRRDKFPGEYDTYWMQTSAYAAMIYEHTGKSVNDLILIFQNTSGETTVERQKTRDWLGKYMSVREAFEDKSHLIQ